MKRVKRVNLEEYKDRPELIQRDPGGDNVVFVHKMPGKENTDHHFMVLFEHGSTCTFTREGKWYSHSKESAFILKPKSKKLKPKSKKKIVGDYWAAKPIEEIADVPKSKKKIVGWRKAVLHNNGEILMPEFNQSQEAFLDFWEGYTLLGDWEKVEYEVEIDL